MSLLDVSEVISDENFTEPAHWVQRRVVVGADGVGVYTQTTTDIMVIPTSGDGSTLDRRRDAGVVEHRQRFYTSAALSPGVKGEDADRILWRGRYYQVSSVADWLGWGQGFVSAACTLLPPDGGVRGDPE